VTLEEDRSRFIISLNEGRPRDLLERVERDSSLSPVDLDVSSGTRSPPGCDVDVDLLGDFDSGLFLIKESAHAGVKVPDDSFDIDGGLVAMRRKDMSVSRLSSEPLLEK